MDPLVGREQQLERVMQILCKRRKNNPCLIGDPGVGKTVIVEGLAQRIVNSSSPFKLQGKKVSLQLIRQLKYFHCTLAIMSRVIFEILNV